MKIKKILALALAVIITIGALPFYMGTTVSAATSGTTGECKWSLEGTVLTISGRGEMQNYYNPSVSPAPWGTSITKVIIKDGVENIGASAFYNCRYLFKIEIPDSIITIGDSAFYRCLGLTNIDFSACPYLQTIGYNAFEECTNLVNVDLSACTRALESIGNEAFYNCSKLTNIVLPSSSKFTSIGGGAFGGTAFYNNDDNWENGVLYINTALIKAKDTISGKYTPKPDTKIIADSAFNGAEILTEIDLSNCKDLLNIGNLAFSSCESLERANLYRCTSLATIDMYAFSGCNKLATVIFAGCTNLNKIGESAFKSCSSLSYIDFSDCTSLTVIERYAFKNCSFLNTVTLPPNIKNIGDEAFRFTNIRNIYYARNNYDRSRISLGSSTGITNTTWHLYYCEKSDSQTHSFSSSVDQYCDYCGFDRIVKSGYTGNCKWQLYDSVLTISAVPGYNGEMRDYTTKSDGYGNYITTAPWGTSVTEVVIEYGVTRIGEYSFTSLGDITKVTFPKTLESIGLLAFSGCSNIKVCDLSSCINLKSIDSGGLGSYLDELHLPSLDVWCNISFAGSPAGYGTDWYLNGELLTEIIIPEDITSINQNTFYGCQTVERIVFPSGLTDIETRAFSDCENLVSLDFSKCTHLENIAYNAFSNCSALTTLDLSACSNLKYIGFQAFIACTKLEKIIIPLSLTSVGYNAFNDCADIIDIWYEGANRKAISIGSPNDGFLNANWHYEHEHIPGNLATCVTDQVCTECGAIVVKSSGHSFERNTKCSEDRVCTVCNEIVPATNHTPGAKATCTSDQLCTVCEEILVKALSHLPGKEATCTSTQNCQICNEVLTIASHTPGNAATCTKDQVCTVCKTVITPALGHTPGKNPTCTTDQTCSVCGEILVEAFGHTPGEDATCTTDQICTVCGETLVAALGHTPGAAATCTADQTCTVCSKVLIEAYGHTPGEDATCTTDQTCSVCGEILVAALGHTDGETVITEPTCTLEGISVTYCDICDAELSRICIKALGHTPGAAATCTKDQVCTVCEEILAKAIGHNYVDSYCTNCNQFEGLSDIDGDGDCTAKDANLLKLYIVGISSEIEDMRADINGDGSVDAKDYNIMKLIISGIYRI